MRISRQKLLSAALVLSVAVNILIGGFVAAQWIDHGPGKPTRQDRFHFDRRAAIASLDEKQQEQFKQLWKDRHSKLRPYFKEFRQYREKLAERFSAETLDLVAIKQTYADMVSKQIQIESLLQATMLELAKTLPEDMRAAFFKEGFRPLKKSPKHKKEDRK